ncbi:hypothetical protein [Fusibacter sp. 3D3]|nr:hypothetical protein [Fusibacter sp. 3D3]
MKSLRCHLYRGHLFILISTFGFSAVPLLAKISLDNGMFSFKIHRDG